MMEITVHEGHGTLNFKVEWQSADGRCCLKFHNTHYEALAHFKSLLRLGRTPQIWGKKEQPDE